jgi:hypothetical protein
MRSDIVFDALATKNRFVLCHEAFKAVRLLHKSNTRIEDTTNDALLRIAAAEPSLIRPEDTAVLPLNPALEAPSRTDAISALIREPSQHPLT